MKKITHYLLNDNHEQGAPKSKFLKAFGFSAGEAWRLKAALEAHAVTNEVVHTTPSEWGTKFVVECSIETPDRRDPCVRSVWLWQDNAGDPLFVTAYPKS